MLRISWQSKEDSSGHLYLQHLLVWYECSWPSFPICSVRICFCSIGASNGSKLNTKTEAEMLLFREL